MFSFSILCISFLNKILIDVLYFECNILDTVVFLSAMTSGNLILWFFQCDHINKCIKYPMFSWVPVLTHVIPATQEAEVRRIAI
jgi:hypothetical protein